MDRPQAEEIVPVGSLDPNQVHLPGIFVDRIVKATTTSLIEFLTLRRGPGAHPVDEALGDGELRLKREMIAKVGGIGL